MPVSLCCLQSGSGQFISRELPPPLAEAVSLPLKKETLLVRVAPAIYLPAISLFLCLSRGLIPEAPLNCRDRHSSGGERKGVSNPFIKRQESILNFLKTIS